MKKGKAYVNGGAGGPRGGRGSCGALSHGSLEIERDYFFRAVQRLGREAGQNLGDEQIEKFYRHAAELLEWNQRINLTRIQDVERIVVEHFVDSLVVTPYLAGARRLLDIGSGGGFPGLVLKVVLPEVRLDIVEARKKKVAFLWEVVRKLELDAVNVWQGRVEERRVQEGLEGTMDAVVCRALVVGNKFLEATARALKPSGKMILMVGDPWRGSVGEVMRSRGGGVVIVPYDLTGIERRRHLLLIGREALQPDTRQVRGVRGA